MNKAEAEALGWRFTAGCSSKGGERQAFVRAEKPGVPSQQCSNEPACVAAVAKWEAGQASRKSLAA